MVCTLCNTTIIDKEAYHQLIWQTSCKHKFHHSCMMDYLGNQIDLYLTELNKRRENHPNDTISQDSKSLSNADIQDQNQLKNLMYPSKAIAEVVPCCPICKKNLMNPRLNTDSEQDLMLDSISEEKLINWENKDNNSNSKMIESIEMMEAASESQLGKKKSSTTNIENIVGQQGL